MNDPKRELLQALEDYYRSEGEPGEMSIFTADELGTTMDMFRMELAGFGSDGVSVLGEFFFMPFEEKGILYFSTVITLLSTVSIGLAPDIAAAVARLNYYLPCGCYALGNKDQNLIYRMTVPLTENRPLEELKKDIILAADTAIGAAEAYEGYLKRVILNELTVEEMINELTK